jgi:hypothetical protein
LSAARPLAICADGRYRAELAVYSISFPRRTQRPPGTLPPLLAFYSGVVRGGNFLFLPVTPATRHHHAVPSAGGKFEVFYYDHSQQRS